MAMIGMDVEQVQNLAGQLHGQAEAIQSVINSVDRIVAQLESAWQGQDARQFADWWNSQHKPALHNAMVAVDGLHTSALNNANEQSQVSSH
jgi:WXG100 family type VII secretion target